MSCSKQVSQGIFKSYSSPCYPLWERKITCLFKSGWESLKSPCLKPDQVVENIRKATGQPTPPLLWYPGCHRLDLQLCIADYTAKESKGKGSLSLLVHRKVSNCLEETKKLHRDSRLPDSSTERNLRLFPCCNYPAALKCLFSGVASLTLPTWSAWLASCLPGRAQEPKPAQYGELPGLQGM